MSASALSSFFTGAPRVARTSSRPASARRTATVTRAAAGTRVKTASIPATFDALKKRGQCAFVPFICAGDPNLDATEKALHILDDAGADVIELGVPYSDPLADGPTIQARPARTLSRTLARTSLRGGRDTKHETRVRRRDTSPLTSGRRVPFAPLSPSHRA